MHEWKGNAPCFWLLSAYDLLCTTHLLEIHIKRLRPIHGWNFMFRGKKVAKSWHALQPNLMIKGFFLENLLKTIAALEGHHFVKEGKLNKLKESNPHGLLQMSHVLQIIFSDEEKSYLKEMEYCIVGYGRYPITPYYQKDSDSNRLFSNPIFQSVMNKLLTRIKLGIQPWPKPIERNLCLQMVQLIEELK